MPLDRDAVEAKLVEIWRRLLNRNDVTVDADWIAFLGAPYNPLLISEIERAFGATLPAAVLWRDSRLADLATTIVTGEVPVDVSRVVRLPYGHRPPALFYVPGAIGEDFHAHGRLMELEYATYVLLASGLNEGETPLRTVAELADDYLEVVTSTAGGRPVVLSGYSMGGLVAVEMARRGRRRGWRPLSVVLIDLMPMIPGTETLTEDDIVTFRLQRLVDQQETVGTDPPPVCFGSELTPEKIEEITSYLYRNRSVALLPGVPWSYLNRRLRVYAANMLAASHHDARPCDVPLVHIRSTPARDAGIQWPELTTAGPPSIIDIDATHSDLWRGPAVTEALTRCLDRVAEAEVVGATEV